MFSLSHDVPRPIAVILFVDSSISNKLNRSIKKCSHLGGYETNGNT